MYQAPVSLNVDAETEVPMDDASEAITFGAASEKLREAQLHHRQVEARALFAPFLAITAILAALVSGWGMYGSERLDIIGGWILVVVLTQLFSCRRALWDAARGSSRTARLGTKTIAVAEAVILAATWAALPTWTYAAQTPDGQIVIAGAMAAMITASIAFSAIPAASIAWIGGLTL